ncbi:nuclear transport factor 2 family protein [Pseudomonas aeruginosa]|uniref:nuclear transport factor 2 family protein n=1 Tax=Pseudomonas aeruginosa TaxID=287 RepID=UPI000AB74B51|nr:nuclear transport factor 2 family protein [Pseudomonas aeruginosa]
MRHESRAAHRPAGSAEAIRQLKHRYLKACDLKEVATIRDCFAEGEVAIDYGPVGTFSERDSFVTL